jgi:hypothetical protein
MHVRPHLPFVHVAVPPAAVHALPHLPHDSGLVLSLTQPPLQAVVGKGHVVAVTQEPLSQSCPAPHFVLHDPHVAEVLKSASQPFAGLPSQSSRPGGHDPTAHAPDLHVIVR